MSHVNIDFKCYAFLSVYFPILSCTFSNSDLFIYFSDVYYPPQPVSRFVRPQPSAPESTPTYLEQYPPYLQDRVVSTQYGTPTQQYSPMNQPMYPAHYDTRRVYPSTPQSYQREEMVRASPVPLDMPPNAGSPYASEARDRYQPVEGYYPVATHPGQIRPSYNRVCAEHILF